MATAAATAGGGSGSDSTMAAATAATAAVTAADTPMPAVTAAAIGGGTTMAVHIATSRIVDGHFTPAKAHVTLASAYGAEGGAAGGATDGAAVGGGGSGGDAAVGGAVLKQHLATMATGTAVTTFTIGQAPPAGDAEAQLRWLLAAVGPVAESLDAIAEPTAVMIHGRGLVPAARISDKWGGSLRLMVSPEAGGVSPIAVHVDQVDVIYGTGCTLGADALFRLGLATVKQADGSVALSFNRVPSPPRARPLLQSNAAAAATVRAAGT